METPTQVFDRVRQAIGFRGRRKGESVGAYRAALADAAEVRDFALAHEVRTGRAQADWSPADVRAFRDHLLARPQASQRRHRPPAMMMSMGQLRVDDDGDWSAAVLRLADGSLDTYQEMRTLFPTKDLVVMLTVVLMDGQILIAPSGRANRFDILRTLVADLPVFAFLVCADVYIHRIDDDGDNQPATATKRDCLVMHVGTRDGLRVMKQRPYRFVDGQPVFDDPPPADVDVRDLPKGDNATDPYADIFVSVPDQPASRPS